MCGKAIPGKRPLCHGAVSVTGARLRRYSRARRTWPRQPTSPRTPIGLNDPGAPLTQRHNGHVRSASDRAESGASALLYSGSAVGSGSGRAGTGVETTMEVVVCPKRRNRSRISSSSPIDGA